MDKEMGALPLLFMALGLCLVTGAAIIMGFVSFLLRKPTMEWLLGYAAAVSAIISYGAYYYARMILSGGTFSDWRVVLVTGIYTVSFILAVILIIHGHKECREIYKDRKSKAM